MSSSSTAVGQLVAAQRARYDEHAWATSDMAAYADRRDETLGQLVSNFHLIELEPFVATLSGRTAVTVCDGRGVEASYLTQFGLRATATDLCTGNLERFHREGRFDDYCEQNAERLSFGNESFDWAMVKAGLHHLPRPPLGLYELLRVAREGIIVLEGHDAALLRLLRRTAFRQRDWEDAGNYVYRFRRREIEKICLGLDLPGYAVRTDFLPFRHKYNQIPRGSRSFRFLWAAHRLANIMLSRQGNLFAAVLFKTRPEKHQLTALRHGGFTWVQLPRNPYRPTAWQEDGKTEEIS